MSDNSTLACIAFRMQRFRFLGTRMVDPEFPLESVLESSLQSLRPFSTVMGRKNRYFLLQPLFPLLKSNFAKTLFFFF